MILSLSDKIWFYSQMFNYAQAGFGIDQSFRSMENNCGKERRSQFVRHLSQGLRDGLTLSESLVSSAAIQPMETTVVRAAETSGMLEKAFLYLSEHFESIAATRKRTLTRLVYPALLVHLAVLLPAIPRYVQTQNLASTVGLSIAILFAVYAITISLVIAFRILARASRTNRRADTFLRRLPLWGRVKRASSLYRFCSVTRMYLECGKKISHSVAAGGEASDSAVIQEASDILANTARDGFPIGTTIFHQAAAFPNDLASGIHTAEKAGMLSEELTRWATLYRHETNENFDRFGKWFPKVIYFFVAAFVVWQILKMFASIYAPVLDLLEAI